MDRAFEAYFPVIKEAFASDARDPVEVDVAFKPGGDVDYIFQRNRLLTLDDGDNVERLQRTFRGLQPVSEPTPGRLVVLSIDGVVGHPSVPEALDILDQKYPDDAAAADEGHVPLATPAHIVDVVRLCPATEPEVPPGNLPGPWPEVRPTVGVPKREVRLLVSDTGRLDDAGSHSWLDPADVTGDADPLEARPGQLPLIRENVGHGTFVAGVARCLAPRVKVFIANHFPASGADVESRMVNTLTARISNDKPDIINLSAGSYTRRDWISLSFESFYRQHRDILPPYAEPLPENRPSLTFIAAAGNDSTRRKFWPAAFDWTTSVGALGPDEQHRAWFSNYGDWVDVYALGEGVVNAFATGEYIYQVPPKRPAIQTFSGLAVWSGTSFATPVVAGMIAEEMAQTGSTAGTSAPTVLDGAVDVPGLGRVLRTR
jgi:subtilisin family serine protease